MRDEQKVSSLNLKRGVVANKKPAESHRALAAHPLEMADLASVAPAAPGSTMRDMVDEADRNAIIVVCAGVHRPRISAR
jgi:hypothetical protein